MIIPVGYAQINHFFVADAAPRGAQVVYGVDNTGSSLSAAAVASAAHDAFVATCLTLMTNEIQIGSTKAKLGPNATGLEAVFTDIVNGTRAQPNVTPQVTLLAQKNTALGGRKQRGRMFLPGAAEEDVNAAGLVSTAALGSWNTTLTDFLAALVTNAIPMVLLHTDATAPSPVTSMVLSELASTQRRRLRKVGGRRRTP